MNRVIGGFGGNDLPREQLLRNLRHGVTEVEQGNPAQQLNSPLRHFWLPFRAFVVDGLGGHEAVAEPLLVPPLSGKLLPRRFNDSWRWASGIEARDSSLNVDGLFGELCHVCKVMSLLLGEQYLFVGPRAVISAWAWPFQNGALSPLEQGDSGRRVRLSGQRRWWVLDGIGGADITLAYGGDGKG